MKEALELLPFILAAYEVLARIVPTSKNWTVVNKIVSILSFLDKTTNVTKKAAKQAAPSAGDMRDIFKRSTNAVLLIAFLGALASCSNTKLIPVSKTTHPVTFVFPDSSYQTVNVPFVDTFQVVRMPKAKPAPVDSTKN